MQPGATQVVQPWPSDHVQVDAHAATARPLQGSHLVAQVGRFGLKPAHL
jgi:hypothetical protein